MRVYLDNAATTQMSPEVVEFMYSTMKEDFGNPSSIHADGRKTRTQIEKARRTIANILGTAPGEIFFTSGGTEAINMALVTSVRDLQCNHIITSPLEHHAVGHTAEFLESTAGVGLSYVNLMPNGHIDLDHLEQLMIDHADKKIVVSLMHANNEIGNLLNAHAVGELCNRHGAVFHCDTVQTIGRVDVKPKEMKSHFLAASAHKFYGPKGVGFIYIDDNLKLKPILFGGSQERNMRGGTENYLGIIAMAYALELAVNDMEKIREHVSGLKNRMIERLRNEFTGIVFNGDCCGNSNYTVLNVGVPMATGGEMLLFNLDIAGISASGGSACTSGSSVGSHVLQAIGVTGNNANIRFSFGKYNTVEEIDFTIETLKKLTESK